jgi:hypothetical protein
MATSLSILGSSLIRNACDALRRFCRNRLRIVDELAEAGALGY